MAALGGSSLYGSFRWQLLVTANFGGSYVWQLLVGDFWWQLLVATLGDSFLWEDMLTALYGIFLGEL